MAAARPRSRCDVRCEALQQLSLPVDVERSRRPLRSRAPSVERLARSRELAHAAELDRRRCPRIRALVERQVPASWRTGDAGLAAADDWRSAVGVRGADAVSRLRACRADLDNQSGRKWRPLADTTTAAQLLYFAPGQWTAYRRSTDFYDEGWLIWLDVDT